LSSAIMSRYIKNSSSVKPSGRSTACCSAGVAPNSDCWPRRAASCSARRRSASLAYCICSVNGSVRAAGASIFGRACCAPPKTGRMASPENSVPPWAPGLIRSMLSPLLSSIISHPNPPYWNRIALGPILSPTCIALVHMSLARFPVRRLLVVSAGLFDNSSKLSLSDCRTHKASGALDGSLRVSSIASCSSLSSRCSRIILWGAIMLLASCTTLSRP